MPPPPPNKRRRVEDEVRPKKKVRHVKKQKWYHSSSEDEEDEPARNGVQRASDAPKPLPTLSAKIQKPSIEQRLAKRSSIQPTSAKPKSILKAASPPKKSQQDSDADEDEVEGGDEEELEKNTALNALKGSEESSADDLAEEDGEPDVDGASSQDSDSDSDDGESITSSQAARTKKKRNDPAAFATSISKILDTKLSTSKRQDPVLSRSKSAAEANKTLADEKLEQKARAQIRTEKRLASEKGRVKDVLGLETPDVDTGLIIEEEKRLKKTAQRGVVKLFNAVRAAQVKAEEAMKQARSEGVVGMQKREERVNEMSKQGFLDLISSGGKAQAATAVSS